MGWTTVNKILDKIGKYFLYLHIFIYEKETKNNYDRPEKQKL